MIPGIIKKSTPLEVDVIHSCIHQVALAFGERLIKVSVKSVKSVKHKLTEYCNAVFATIP